MIAGVKNDRETCYLCFTGAWGGCGRVWAGGVVLVGRVESQQITLSPPLSCTTKKPSTVQCMNVCCSTVQTVVLFAAALFRLLYCLLQDCSDCCIVCCSTVQTVVFFAAALFRLLYFLLQHCSDCCIVCCSTVQTVVLFAAALFRLL